ncbi:ABC transporter ATP-binding protein [Candidatus Falkowbacteria bacterium HGW-Falkowbacteria-2]|uniref:ABC transporter ATP-binding protein n=1 Tax=Candidatus Falkowbacteria bacterium HGW-Falkowbacteria-2 TaxID=2013769 RepID=A0A2N2E3Q7_9BACT|nr:MAG: ABC transporter ATP-binding protein [Candidatus Falkowbacteria bacterium HGW-Falkowbacteria-2]
MDKEKKKSAQPGLLSLLKPYRALILLLIILAIAANGLTLWIPLLLAQGIDGFFSGENLRPIYIQFAWASAGIFLLTFLQNIAQTYASEIVARDLRNRLSEKISNQSFASVQTITPAKLLTNLTADIDAIKNFVAFAVAQIVISLFLILGGSYLLIAIDWRLGLAVLSILPLIGLAFAIIFGKVKTLFTKAREAIDWLNKVINESILGAALIRVVNSHETEHTKFSAANTDAKDVGIRILKLFAALIPTITFLANFAILIILVMGGRFIIQGSLTLGEFASFNSYVAILIFPVLILGFVSNIIAQAQASYERIVEVLTAADPAEEGTITTPLTGSIQIEGVDLVFGEKKALKKVSLDIKAGTRVAIIGPTAAGKTQLLNLLVGLLPPSVGHIRYDNHDLSEYKKEELYKQVGLVFQDSIMFNVSLRENIAFNTEVNEEDLQKAIRTAELSNYIARLPKGLHTVVSERGQSLSGGQKQRIMLARALAINPKILLLDDFTARVDNSTEKKILDNIAKNYPELTLVSVTQKIASVESYDQIIVLMEGEVIASGKHQHLLSTSPEYVQIFNSQQSTETL